MTGQTRIISWLQPFLTTGVHVCPLVAEGSMRLHQVQSFPGADETGYHNIIGQNCQNFPITVWRPEFQLTRNRAVLPMRALEGETLFASSSGEKVYVSEKTYVKSKIFFIFFKFLSITSFTKTFDDRCSLELSTGLNEYKCLCQLKTILTSG